eukprot:TRINITY_DN10862_c0_g1_i1.p1 TRINITY_DN10862_c0_g1~~TRINITY_DN10862_c0_g1_i1.p1  ORF type:complete len:221 (+),score=25.29 TRINITY_DN10862_c0_g1_i1:152-814(+)
MKNLAICLVALAYLSIATACGCYGQGTCTLDGVLVNSVDPACPSAYCDCCPACNSCNQLLAGCLRNRLESLNISAVPSRFTVNQPISPITIYTSYLSDLCIQPSLPSGLNYTISNGLFVISGTPTELVGPTQYYVVAKGAAGYVGNGNLSFAVGRGDCIQISTTGSSSACSVGDQRCASSSSFQQCAYLNANLDTYWGSAQQCPDGTTCRQNGNQITCDY